MRQGDSKKSQTINNTTMRMIEINHTNHTRCMWNRWVFNSFLKLKPDSAFLKGGGLFQRVGASTAKAWSPLVQGLDFGPVLVGRPERSACNHIKDEINKIKYVQKWALEMLCSMCQPFYLPLGFSHILSTPLFYLPKNIGCFQQYFIPSCNAKS